MTGLLAGSDSAHAYGNGDGTADTGTVIGTPIPLVETLNTTLNGDYVSAGIGMRDTGPPGGGTIALPAIPGTATVQQAFLYWAVMDDTALPALADGIINGTPITGSFIGTTEDPCWTGDIHVYVKDVTAEVLPGANNVLTGFASSGVIATLPLLEGASIVLIYSDALSPKRTVIIHEGAVSFAAPPAESTTFTGFNAGAGTSQTTYVMADGQGLRNRTLVDGTETADFVLDGTSTPGSIYWDNLTQNISAFIPPGDTAVTVEAESLNFGGFDCLTWVAQVLSVPAIQGGGPPAVGGIAGLLDPDSGLSAQSGGLDGGSTPWQVVLAAISALTLVITASGLMVGFGRVRR